MARVRYFLFSSFTLLPVVALAGDTSQPFASHQPARPLPMASERPLEEGPAWFVHPAEGNDEWEGTRERPWQTMGHAVTRLQAGQTLVLRGGTYYEHVAARLVGTIDKPITIRAFPGELAILDGGLREFFEQPDEAWEPCPGGAEGEFQSKKTYPELKAEGDGPGVFGNFGDSLVPLQAYRFHGDLRSDNPFWNVENKVGSESFVYCGPGIFYNAETGRIHCRLAHTKLSGLGDDNYRGETDPRKISLIVAGGEEPPLALVSCQNVRLQDLVLRGSRRPTLQIHDCRNIELDGLSAYGGHSAVQVRDTWGLRMQHCACRGIGAPWTFRGMLKYRSVEARIFDASHWDPTGADNRDFEIRYCEFTDSVDGVFLGNVRGVRFHHNLVENVTDDGVFLTAGTAYDGQTWGGDMQFYQNRFARILTTFAFGVGHGRQKAIDLGDGKTGKQTGSGAYIYRNVFDFRRPVWYTWPSGPDAPQEITSRGRFASDHGGPTWEPMWIYHNTILAGDTPRYDYGCDGLIHGVASGAKRRVFNNIVVLTQGTPGSTLPPPEADFQADGNLFWSLAPDKPLPENLFAKFQGSEAFERSKKEYPPGWTARDKTANPEFIELSADWHERPRLHPKLLSPAYEGGVPLAKEWPDYGDRDGQQATIGALPMAPIPRRAGSPRIGVHGRVSLDDGAAIVNWTGSWASADWHFKPSPSRDDATMPRALIVEGYPAFDAPIVAYLLRKVGWQVETSDRAWADTAKWKDYQLVVYDGSLARAGLEKTAFDEADVANVRAFLEAGGTLLLTRERHDLFRSEAGRKLLAEIVGEGQREAKPQISILQPDHPWLAPLKTPIQRAAALPVFRFPDEKDKAPPPAPALDPFPWLAKGTPIPTSKGQSLIGSPGGASLLHRAPFGRGQLIYVGWSPAASIPHGREKSTLEMEADFEQQVAVLREIVESAQRGKAE
ncbi:MAG TPA: hypothetical protein VFV87_22205 [Pirellulaceae bacterium]|nr:hypothetical protein [Pirellulaceae bacterium]